jgi:hypothetical protein
MLRPVYPTMTTGMSCSVLRALIVYVVVLLLPAAGRAGVGGGDGLARRVRCSWRDRVPLPHPGQGDRSCEPFRLECRLSV